MMLAPICSLKDVIEVVVATGGVVGALVVFIIGLVTARQELRRKYAEAGRSLITEMCDDVESQNAFAMLDMEDGGVAKLLKVEGDQKSIVPVEWSSVEKAIAQTPGEPVKPDHAELVRDAFDSLFYYFALFEHCIDAKLISLADVNYPACYYIRILGEVKAPFLGYLDRHKLVEAKTFLERWAEWTGPRKKTIGPEHSIAAQKPG